ncbi:uncharacterized protein TNCV_757171 [Trichonephila clavipes]|nr:uncharacterized protein TNCV_757171 [Trichonephila clavipes]
MAKGKSTPVVSRSFENHTGDSTIWIVSTPGSGQSPITSLTLPSTSREDLLLAEYLECLHAPQALFIYKNPYLLRDSNPGPAARASNVHSTQLNLFSTSSFMRNKKVLENIKTGNPEAIDM